MANNKRQGPLTIAETEEVENKFKAAPARQVTCHVVPSELSPVKLEALEGAYRLEGVIIPIENQTPSAILGLLIDYFEQKQGDAPSPDNSMALTYCRKALWHTTAKRRREVYYILNTAGAPR